MYRKLRLTILLFISFIFLLLSIHFRLEAGEIRRTAVSTDNSLQDEWYDRISESRTFSTLIVSIQADEEDLYSDDSGILSSQYMLQGMEGERPIEIFVYDQDGTPLIAQKAGIRINGAGSRTAIRKSFRIIARDKYSSQMPNFTYDLWGDRKTVDGSDQHITEYQSFILHAIRLGADSTGIHNSVGYSLAEKAGIIDASPTTPAAVYINGKYQGTYFIMPAKNDNAFAELYHIRNREDIELVSVFSGEKTGYQDHPEVLSEFLDFVSYVQTSDVNDPEVVSRIEKQLDVHQCLQYYAVNLLLANGDWINNNLRVWRCRDNGLPYQDGKWRFFLFDLDWIGSFPDSVPMNFQQVTQSNDYYNLLHSLLKNPEWLAEFKEIIADMESNAFNAITIESVFAEEEARIHDEMAYDYQSDAFVSYLQYSVNSEPPTEEDYLTLKDRDLLIEDFKSHMLKAPAMVDECLRVYYP